MKIKTGTPFTRIGKLNGESQIRINQSIACLQVKKVLIFVIALYYLGAISFCCIKIDFFISKFNYFVKGERYMLKKILLLVLVGCVNAAVPQFNDACKGSLEGSLDGCLDNNFDRFSLILFTLEKNVVRVERYSLDELAHDVNRLSRNYCNTHCRYILRLGEQGQQVTDIGWNFSDIHNVMIETSRNKKSIYYALDWVSLLAQTNAKAENFMRADVSIREVFNVDMKTARETMTRGMTWLSSLAIVWGISSHQLVINLIIEGKVQAVCAAVVPNYFLDDTLEPCVDLKKHELVQAGVLTKIG